MSESNARRVYDAACEFIEEKLRVRENRSVAAAPFEKCIIGREGVEVPLLFVNKVSKQTHDTVTGWRDGANLYTQADAENSHQPILYIPFKSSGRHHHHHSSSSSSRRPSLLVGLAWGACLLVIAGVAVIGPF
jgi:hypothetical protein